MCARYACARADTAAPIPAANGRMIEAGKKSSLVDHVVDSPEVFAGKVDTLLGSINDTGRIQLTYRRGNAKIRRNARTHAPEEGILGDARSTVLHGESSPLANDPHANDISLQILRLTGANPALRAITGTRLTDQVPLCAISIPMAPGICHRRPWR